MKKNIELTNRQLKAPRAGAIAGIIFSTLLMTSLILIRMTVPDDPQDPGAWLSTGWKKVSVALHLLPFSGIAFLWFVGVIRDRIGEYEDRFFATVFLGSGLLFLAMLFVFSAVAGGMMMLYMTSPDKLIGFGLYRFGRVMIYQLLNVYALRMAGVFMITTSTLAIRTGVFPRWIALLGYALAIILLVSIGHYSWITLVFPLWVLLISCYVLMVNLKSKPSADI